jgi:glycosyltransferase involved in cell wall biosynthesis
VPPMDARALADALLTMINDADLRLKMGASSREHATQYDWGILADRLLHFYQETLDRVNGRGASPETA